MKIRSPLLLSLMATWFVLNAAGAQGNETPHVRVELLSDVRAITPGARFHLGVRFQLEKGWHIYWKNPGDAGLATHIDWELPPGFTAGQLQWPLPAVIGEAPEVSYGYAGEVMLHITVTAPKHLPDVDSLTVRARASWLVCKEMCLPGKAAVSLALPLGRAGRTPEATTVEFDDRPYLDADGRVTARMRGDTIELRITSHELLPVYPGAAPVFIAADSEVIEHSAPQPFVERGGVPTLLLVKSSYASHRPERLRGLLTVPNGWTDRRARRDADLRAIAIDVPIEASP